MMFIFPLVGAALIYGPFILFIMVLVHSDHLVFKLFIFSALGLAVGFFNRNIKRNMVSGIVSGMTVFFISGGIPLRFNTGV